MENIKQQIIMLSVTKISIDDKSISISSIDFSSCLEN